MRDASEYANTLKGATLYAKAQWEYWCDYQPQGESDEMIRSGNMQAYSAMLRQMTGCMRPDDERFASIVEAM